MSDELIRTKPLIPNLTEARPLAGAGEGPAGSAAWDDLRALRAVVEGTAHGTGEEFFQSLVRHLA